MSELSSLVHRLGACKRHSQHRRPIYMGILPASAGPSVGLLLLNALDGTWPDSLSDWAFMLLPFIVSLGGVILFGLLVVFSLRRCVWLTWLNVLLCSFLAGVLYWQFLIEIIFQWNTSLSDSLLGGVCGFLSGVGFCLGIWPHNLFRLADAANGR